MPHDLIVGIGFLAILIAPAVIAAFSNSSEAQAE